MLLPRGARAVVKRLPAPKPVASLIEIPDTVVDKPSPFAIVLAIGKLREGGFDIGDTVILKDFSGIPCVVDLDGEQIEAHIVPEEDVLAVVEGM